jgi:DNA polymerase III subunit delta'
MSTAEPACLLPWHREQWQSLLARRRAGRLPHALLFTGPRGGGKEQFARFLAQALLCATPRAEGQPCQSCAACHQYQAGTHPDAKELRPEEQDKPIRVDQVRELAAFMALTSRGFKVAVIVPAHHMNLAAANSLLKTLEEPPPGSLLVLVSSRAAALPATVRSRCQRLAFPGTSSADSVAWLKQRVPDADAEALLRLCGGAPLTAMEWARRGLLQQRQALFQDFERLANAQAEPVASAAHWSKVGLKEALHWMMSWLGDMIRLKMAPAARRLENPDLRPGLQALADGIDARRLYDQWDRSSEAVKLLNVPSNVNAQLLLEGVLISWSGAAGA